MSHCPDFRGSKLDVGGWMLGVCHKYCEYKPPVPPHSGWSGGTMVPPWYRPIPIEHFQSPIFDQLSLSKTRKPIPEPAAKRRKRPNAAKPQPKAELTTDCADATDKGNPRNPCNSRSKTIAACEQLRLLQCKRDWNWAFFCDSCASSRLTHLPPEVYSQNIKAETSHPHWFDPG